jgi:serine/threonine protein kinase
MSDSYNVNALEPGTMIQEFKVLRILGAGSFGIVYLAENVYFPEKVAIKEFLPSQLAQRADGSTVVPTSSGTQEAYQWALDKFVKEARILWELGRPERHPNIAFVSRFHEANGTAYMVMDFEKGESLSDKLDREGTLREAELKAIVFPLLDGLNKVHAKSVWHRDIKPANILIRPDGSPVLIDFGAARWEAGEQERSIMEVFTPEYAAPEQIYSHGNLGPWTDIYCLAATLYRAIQGKPPASPSQRALGTDHVPASEAAARGFSPRFLAGLDAALALKPEDRPQDVITWRRMLGKASKTRPGNRAGGTSKAAAAARTGQERLASARSATKPGKSQQPSVASAPSKTKQRTVTSVGVVAIVVGLLVVAVTAYMWLSDGTGTSDSDATTSIETTKTADKVQEPKDASSSDEASAPTSDTTESASGGAIEIDPAKVMATANTVIGKLACASLSVLLTDRRRLELSGFVDTPGTLREVRSRLADIEGVRGVGGVVETYPRPFCSILMLLAQQANLDSESFSVPWIQLDRANGRYFEGDRLIITVTQTDEFGGYLYIDYVDSTGSLVHMLPTGWRTDNEVGAGKQIDIGTEGRYEIAPPHGQAMIIAVATRQPLFRSMRPEAESADTYLEALAKRLKALSQSDDPLESVSSFVFFTTSPKG